MKNFPSLSVGINQVLALQRRVDQQVAGGGAGLAVEHVGIAGLAELDRLDGLLDLIHCAINIDTDEEQADDLFTFASSYRGVLVM